MLTTSNELLRTRIEAFVVKANEISAEYFKTMNYTFSKPPIHRADYLSDKWAKIVTLDEVDGTWKDRSVYAFICLKDNTTKALGTVRTGDIHKAATYNSPAKTARGNVFSEDFGKCLTPHGIVYLRG